MNAENSDIHRKIRKCRNTLYILGTGIITLGLWTAAQIVLMLLNSPQTFFIDETAFYFGDSRIVLFYLLLIIILTLLIAGIYLLAGLKARAEGLGKKRSVFYILLCAVLAIVHTSSTIYSFLSLFIDTGNQYPLARNIVSVIVESTAASVLVELICAAVKIRIYERKADEGRE